MTDKRLIEDYLPIEAISAQARREKSMSQGHLHAAFGVGEAYLAEHGLYQEETQLQK